MFDMRNNIMPFIGIVENNVDERLEGRVQVRAFGMHGTANEIPTSELPWAIPIIGSYDYNAPVPALNSWVFGFFLDGKDAQQPMLLGIIPMMNTTIPNQETSGIGAPIRENYELLSYGSRSQDIGQPNSSNLTRGEKLEDTYIVAQEATRIKGIVGADGKEWEEPAAAYAAEYPFNRVIETPGGTSIELDDTPGAERMMIYHSSGSYMQIDSRGTTTHKATSDKYDMNETNMHVYVGGKATVNILGDASIKIAGNKIEEVGGDYKLIVRGNYELSAAGQMNLNGSDEIQMRAAKITAESNVENISLKSAKEVKIESGEATHIKSKDIYLTSAETLQMKNKDLIMGGDEISMIFDDVSISGKDINMEGSTAVKIGSSSTNIYGDVVKIGSDSGSVQISGSPTRVNSLIEGGAGSPTKPSVSDSKPVEASESKAVTMPEPATKAVSITGGEAVQRSSMGSAGFVSSDNQPEYSGDYQGDSGGQGDSGSAEYSDISPGSSSCSSDLIEELKKYESFSAKAYWDSQQWSVGYGLYTNNPNEIVTEAEASARLKVRVYSDRQKVANYGKSSGYNWNDCQVDALTSFVYNNGYGAIKELTANATRSDEQIAQALLLYNTAKINGVRKVLPGLTKRRKSESDWFRNGTIKSPQASTAPTIGPQ